MIHFLSFSSNAWQAALLSVGSTKHQASMYAEEKYQKRKKRNAKNSIILSKDLKRWREEVDR